MNADMVPWQNVVPLFEPHVQHKFIALSSMCELLHAYAQEKTFLTCIKVPGKFLCRLACLFLLASTTCFFDSHSRFLNLCEPKKVSRDALMLEKAHVRPCAIPKRNYMVLGQIEM